jgi:protein-S-isoprenylcysteine O-methyltransferase Ste14
MNKTSTPIGLGFSVFLRLISGVAIIGAIFFFTAGTIHFWQAWLYIAVLFTPMTIYALYLLKKHQTVLKRRMDLKEREKQQKWIIVLSTLLILAIFLIPGFDKRFGWSNVSVWISICANLFVFIGYMFFILTIRTNEFAARTVSVEEGQKVISSGVYAIVRHPMYLAMTIIFLFTPIALGSYWAVLPALVFPFILVLRLLNEEKKLIKELDGYEEYCKKVKYHLIPGVW